VHEVPTRETPLPEERAPRGSGGSSPGHQQAPADDQWGEAAEEAPPWAEPDEVSDAPAADAAPARAWVEEPVDAPEEEEPAAEEVDEATFFVEQGLDEEAREILETVLIAYPGHARATRLLAQLDARAAAPATGEPAGEGGDSRAFDLARQLAEELGGEEDAAAPPAGDDYQVSVEEVFAEFKKGLEKVVKPEDVDTHYDLGVAYKEMGLTDDAVSEFTIARKGCMGKRKEVDCLSMIGLLQLLRNDPHAAVDAFQQALATEHGGGDVEKSLRYELAMAWDAADQQGRALGQFLKVQQLDHAFRDVGAHVARLSSLVAPEDGDAPAARPPPPPPSGRGPGTSGASGARKVGYV
jgi:tetratricopeptide (TPR) repeat protein